MTKWRGFAYWVKVKVAGLRRGDTLYFHNGLHNCGSVRNGVAFETNDEGVYVISLEELERLVEIAKEYREAVA